MTNAEYQRFLEAKENSDVKPPEFWTNSQFNGPQQPVVGVSWHEAQAFAKWAGCRLPTEAEWVCACRAGTQTEYSFGDDEKLLKDHAWSDVNSGNKTHAVGEMKPNPWGLYDMHGNVWEWCRDGQRSYTKRAQIDPVGPIEDGRARVVRGGAWFDYDPGDFRASSRLNGGPVGRYYDRGFRCVLVGVSGRGWR